MTRTASTMKSVIGGCLINKTGELRIWWIRNVPGHPENYPVGDLVEAVEVYDQLILADLFSDDVESNVGGLQVYVGEQEYETDDGWEEWESEDYWGGFDEYYDKEKGDGE
ncbi:hypothetical protein LCGC14_1417600 [marine sediment metagenome]|uniref:Uncharacterized protein n=1 Tax=marine sediment metagenome TaxID=412755 RepID=A0A0F9JS61_9ZZZZ